MRARDLSRVYLDLAILLFWVPMGYPQTRQEPRAPYFTVISMKDPDINMSRFVTCVYITVIYFSWLVLGQGSKPNARFGEVYVYPSKWDTRKIIEIWDTCVRFSGRFRDGLLNDYSASQKPPYSSI